MVGNGAAIQVNAFTIIRSPYHSEQYQLGLSSSAFNLDTIVFPTTLMMILFAVAIMTPATYKRKIYLGLLRVWCSPFYYHKQKQWCGNPPDNAQNIKSKAKTASIRARLCFPLYFISTSPDIPAGAHGGSTPPSRPYPTGKH